MTQARKHAHPGFTLVEIIVVVSIIALLASIILANISSARALARDTVRISDLKLIGAALDLYRQEHGSYPFCPFCMSKHPSGGTTDYGWNDGVNVWKLVDSVPVSVSVSLGRDLAPYIAKLPRDPVNNRILFFIPGWFFSDQAYSYLYNSRSLNYDLNYELVTRLETKEHPYRCELEGYISNTFGTDLGWCEEAGTVSSLFQGDNGRTIFAVQR